jgi:hypothetical protein
MRLALLIGAAWVAVALPDLAQTPAPAPEELPLPIPDPGSMLPDEPIKGVVLVQCDRCHGLAWIERSGGSLEGWTSRVRRMNRAGAMIPEEQIPLIAAYLAKALPERPRPPPEKRGHSSRRP